MPENHRRFSYRSTISISNTNGELIRYIHKIAGVRHIYRLPEKRNDWKDKFQYYATAGSVRILLLKIMPYLVLKRPQAEVMMEFLPLIGWQGRKVPYDGRIDYLYQKIRALNTKGKQPKPEAHVTYAARPPVQD